MIDKKILVCHGGISNKTNLAEIDKLDRHQYMSVLNPPQDESLPEGHPDKINFKEWRQILDTLWSDPKPQNGCEPNTFRGGGCYFGPDICNLASFKLYTNDKPDFIHLTSLRNHPSVEIMAIRQQSLRQLNDS